jgi:hypothetical protein
MLTLEFNTKKLKRTSKELSIVAANLMREMYDQKISLDLLDKLNLSTGDDGLMDMQMEQKRSLIKFLDAQLDLIQDIILLTNQK